MFIYNILICFDSYRKETKQKLTFLLKLIHFYRGNRCRNTAVFLFYAVKSVFSKRVVGNVISSVFLVAEHAPFVHIAVGYVTEQGKHFAEFYDIAVASQHFDEVGIE